MSTEPTPIDDTLAEELVASYDATSEALEQSGEEKAAGMMTDESLLRACQQPNDEPGNPDADGLLAEIGRRGLDVMMADEALWSEALTIDRLHAERAPQHIAERIAALGSAGNMKGVRRWQHIAVLFGQLQAGRGLH